MSILISFVIYFLIVPVMYLGIIVFDFMLILRAKKLYNRWQGLSGAFAGLLIALMFMLLDQSYEIIKVAPPTINLQQVWPYAVIAGVLGFTLMIFIDIFLQRGAVGFVILANVGVLLVSAYYLIIQSENRLPATIAIIGLLVGIIIYFILFPTRIFNTIRGKEIE